MLREVTNFKGVSTCATDPGTILDQPPLYQAATHDVYPQGPQYPQSGGSFSQSQDVVIDQVTV